jgi:hypothetical protein
LSFFYYIRSNPFFGDSLRGRVFSAFVAAPSFPSDPPSIPSGHSNVQVQGK